MKEALKRLYRRFPYSIRQKIWRVYAGTLTNLKHSKKDDIPAASTIFIGGGDFEAVGNEFFQIFQKYGHLAPDQDVLDVGSGQGRMTRPLATFLAPTASYCGIEIVPDAVQWCQKTFQDQSNFRFIHADIFNKHYNPKGKFKAAEYRFPLENSSFDFVFLTSVFTHMFAEDIENYLSEIARVLRPGGVCLITYFIYNEASERCIREGRTGMQFEFPLSDVSWTINPDDPETATAFNEDYLRALYAKNGLTIEEPIHFGAWCKTPGYVTLQDMIVARKSVP
jgi:SAM-dependent methyltransferase